MYKKPKDLIPKDTLELLLTDMYLAVASNNIKDKCFKKRENYTPFVFEKYQIDSTRFYNSNNYYTSKIEDYKDILNAVKARIQKDYDFFEVELAYNDAIKKEKKKKRLKIKDSLRLEREAQKKEDYIPLIVREFKKDTTQFYSNSQYYNSANKDYHLIIKEISELEEENDD